MSSRKFNLPSVNALIAFEAVARLNGFGRAAEELNTSQSAISRHIRNLELRLGAALFVRDGTHIYLTPKGHVFFAQIANGLSGLQEAVHTMQMGSNEVTLACSHEVSHLLLMPRYGALKQALGNKTDLRIVTTEYNLVSAAVDTGADIVFEYSMTPPTREHVRVCAEEIVPVGTSGVITAANAAMRTKATPPPLLALGKANYGWLDWQDWQGAHTATQAWRVGETFDNYVYLLEAAVQGQGLALGWRGFANRYLESGVLQKLDANWFSKGTSLYARLTRFGETNASARKCLTLLESIVA